jgi:hypothetical protein
MASYDWLMMKVLTLREPLKPFFSVMWQADLRKKVDELGAGIRKGSRAPHDASRVAFRVSGL